MVQFTLEPPSHANLIRGYSGTELLIGQQRLTRSCIVTAQQFASAQVRAAFAQRRVGIEVMQLGAACRTFNVLVQEERRVAAALFLR